MTSPYLDPATIHTPAVATSPPAAWGNTLRDNGEALARPPGCALSTSGTVVIPTGTGWTSVPYAGADRRDTDGFHSPTSNPERITIPSGMSGWYILTGQVTVAANAAGFRNLRALVNGSQSLPACYLPAAVASGSAIVLPISMELDLTAGDYVEVQAQQNSGNGLAASSLVSLRLVAWA